MNKATLGSKTVIREERTAKDGAEYTYRLFVKKSEMVASFRLPLYSVSVEMTDALGNRTEATLNDVFADVGKAHNFFDYIFENLATPLNLPYVLEDVMKVK
ncbi:MAG: hypothetical protein IJX38_01310 [Clostridia bacterium]|nr:hypothetical protein [Clostridia bacterium]